MTEKDKKKAEIEALSRRLEKLFSSTKLSEAEKKALSQEILKIIYKR